MTQHTPGPWVAGRPDMGTYVDGHISKWIYANGKYIAVASGRNTSDWDEVIANANLIAAAPELLEALEEMSPGLPSIDAPCHIGTTTQDNCAYCSRIKKVLTAIKKARGES